MELVSALNHGVGFVSLIADSSIKWFVQWLQQLLTHPCL